MMHLHLSFMGLLTLQMAYMTTTNDFSYETQTYIPSHRREKKRNVNQSYNYLGEKSSRTYLLESSLDLYISI